MLRKMTDQERARWMDGRQGHSVVTRRQVSCDECDEVAVSIGHSGAGTKVHVFCAEHFLSDLNRERGARWRMRSPVSSSEVDPSLVLRRPVPAWAR